MGSKQVIQRGLMVSLAFVMGACGDEPEPRELGPNKERIVDGEQWAGDIAAGFLSCGKGDFAFCSGTLVGAQTVLTAAHCVDAAGYCGDDLAFFTEDAGGLHRHAVERSHVHPLWNGKDAWDYDIAVLRLAEPAVGVTPILLADRAPAVGDRLDLVGYGLTMGGGSDNGTKRIATASVTEVKDRLVLFDRTEDGDGGVCNGDSGGPGLAWSNFRRRIIGVHSHVYNECGHLGGQVRVDAYANWIAQKSEGDLGCGNIDYQGGCHGSMLVWCSGAEQLSYMQCADYANTPSCGWLNDEIGYSCLPAEDGEPTPKPDAPGAYGAQCDALGYVGACYGETSVWSQDGECRVRDCADEGRACGWIDDATGWGCLGGTEGATTFSCTALDYAGRCMADDTLVWVEDGTCRAQHCPGDGRICGWDDRPLADGSGPIGFNCLAG